VSSRLGWTEQKVKITQTTDLPFTDTVHLSIETADQQGQCLSIYLRVPYWAAGELAVAVNGEAVRPQVKNGYALIERVWKNGDTVQVQIPMKAAYSSLPDAPHVVGFKYGPVVLSAALGMDDMIESRTGVIVSVPTRRMLVKDFIIPRGMSVQEWFNGFDQHFIRKDGELAFIIRNTDEDSHLVFTPHYMRHNERYGIYWKFVEEGSTELRAHLEKTELEQHLREATIDSVQVGNDQYELEHQVKGELTHAGTWEGLNGRRAEPNGWFSYEMKVLPGVMNGLAVTYNSMFTNRSMEIWIDGKLLTTETFQMEWKRAFYEKTYEIPADMIESGQKSVEVKFAPREGLNGIYGILRSVKL
jgi:uncharacterized protein